MVKRARWKSVVFLAAVLIGGVVALGFINSKMRERKAFVGSIPTGIVLSEYHHIQVNRALIAAVKTDDTNKALAALHAGGEADYPRKVPGPLWIRWLDRTAGFKALSEERKPSLLAQAVQHNNTILVNALLDKGAADVQGFIASTPYRNSPIESIPHAAKAGDVEIVRILKQAGARE